MGDCGLGPKEVRHHTLNQVPNNSLDNDDHEQYLYIAYDDDLSNMI